MGKKIKLGKAHNVGVVTEPKTVDERLRVLEDRISSLTQAFNEVNSAMVKDSRIGTEYDELKLPENRRQDTRKSGLLRGHTNRDGVPIGMSLLGQSERGGTRVLSVKHDKYYIGVKGYNSLSAAAEAASGVRRSGWTFWKTSDGRTAKEAYGKPNV